MPLKLAPLVSPEGNAVSSRGGTGVGRKGGGACEKGHDESESWRRSRRRRGRRGGEGRGEVGARDFSSDPLARSFWSSLSRTSSES